LPLLLLLPRVAHEITTHKEIWWWVEAGYGDGDAGAGQESNAMGAARTGMDEDCRYGSHRRVGGHERTGLDGKHARPRDDSLFRSPVKMIF
jgi:hypothetical protein